MEKEEQSAHVSLEVMAALHCVGASASFSPNKQRRNRETVSPYKIKKGSEYMEVNRVPMSTGPWNFLETLCLVVCQEILLSTSIPLNPANLSALYRFVAESNNLQGLSLQINTKTTAQVTGKMTHLKQWEHGP